MPADVAAFLQHMHEPSCVTKVQYMARLTRTAMVVCIKPRLEQNLHLTFGTHISSVTDDTEYMGLNAVQLDAVFASQIRCLTTEDGS